MKLLAPCIGIATPLLLLSSREASVSTSTPAHILWSSVLVCGPLATLFGFLLVLYAFQHLQTTLIRNLITTVLSVLFLATIGVTSTSLQLLLTALNGSTVLSLILISALGAVLTSALGYGGQAVLRLSAAQLAFWGNILIVSGFFLTSIVVTVILLTTYR